MDLILNAETLQPPLTGIGRYTRHLIEELSHCEEVSRLRCFYRGGLVEARRCLGEVEAAGHKTTQRRDRRLTLLRAVASQMTLPYHIHKFRGRQIFRRRTRGMSNWVYHDPNFILQPFKGPAVVTVHDLSALRYPEFHPKPRVQYMNRNLAHSLDRAHEVITDSNFVRDELLAYFSLPATKITAIHLGVSDDFKPARPDQTEKVLDRYGLRHRNYLLCVATFEPRKNLSRLINAYVALPESIRRRWPLILVGSRGWRSSDLAAKARARMAPGAIRSLGYVPRGDLPVLYAGARVFVFPSIYEGFGLPVLEAMACATPVVTSQDTSMAEITRNTALLVDPKDTRAIRDGLSTLLDDEALSDRLGAAGRERAKAFTWHRCAQAHLAVYRRASAR